MKSFEPSETATGALFALAAFLSWGFLPIYWKLLGSVPAFQILLHRMVWSFLFLVIILSLQRNWGAFSAIFRQKKTILILLTTSLLIGVNWLIYIWAVNANHIVETSLGYFINPLINVLLGMLFLREKLNWRQLLAVALAFVGVMNSVINLGAFPWIALSLAFSFGFYGLLRKVVVVESLVGLAFETAILFPLAIGMLGWFAYTGELAMGQDLKVDALLIGAGVITAFPLIWFACGARRLRLSTIGFFQYLAPSCQLMIAVFIYNESFTQDHLITFVLIWIALFIYSIDSLLKQQRNRREASKMHNASKSKV